MLVASAQDARTVHVCDARPVFDSQGVTSVACATLDLHCTVKPIGLDVLYVVHDVLLGCICRIADNYKQRYNAGIIVYKTISEVKRGWAIGRTRCAVSAAMAALSPYKGKGKRYNI